jgi:hypothetical protein
VEPVSPSPPSGSCRPRLTDNFPPSGSARRQGTADRAQQRTRDRSSSPAAGYDGGGAPGLPQQGGFGIVGNDVDGDPHIRVTLLGPLGSAVDPRSTVG